METDMDGSLGFDWTVADRVRAIIALNALLHIDKVQPDHRLQDLGLDSLGIVEVIFALEESFDISVPFNANDPGQSRFDITTVGAVIAGVEGLIAAR
jgi:acyl carrier protein